MVNVLFGIKVVALMTLVVVLSGCDSIIVFDLIQLIMTAEVQPTIKIVIKIFASV